MRLPNWWSLYAFVIEALTIDKSLHVWISADKLPNLCFPLVVDGTFSASPATGLGSFRGPNIGYQLLPSRRQQRFFLVIVKSRGDFRSLVNKDLKLDNFISLKF